VLPASGRLDLAAIGNAGQILFHFVFAALHDNKQNLAQLKLWRRRRRLHSASRSRLWGLAAGEWPARTFSLVADKNDRCRTSWRPAAALVMVGSVISGSASSIVGAPLPLYACLCACVLMIKRRMAAGASAFAALIDRPASQPAGRPDNLVADQLAAMTNSPTIRQRARIRLGARQAINHCSRRPTRSGGHFGCGRPALAAAASETSPPTQPSD
jgi:hypothetical protein